MPPFRVITILLAVLAAVAALLLAHLQQRIGDAEGEKDHAQPEGARGMLRGGASAVRVVHEGTLCTAESTLRVFQCPRILPGPVRWRALCLAGNAA